MQELIGRLENSGMPLGSYDYDIFEELLEKEKEQIIDAFEYGQINVNEDGCLSEENGAEEYYNQTYNQNK